MKHTDEKNGPPLAYSAAELLHDPEPVEIERASKAAWRLKRVRHDKAPRSDWDQLSDAACDPVREIVAEALKAFLKGRRRQ